MKRSPSPRICWFWVIVLLLFFDTAFSQTTEVPKGSTDTICVDAGMLVILKDSFFITTADTLLPTNGEKVRIRRDPYQHTKAFYDSLAVKAGKSKVKKELYKLFIRDNNPVKNVAKNEKTREAYFRKYRKKIVRDVKTLRVPILDGDVNDTSWVTTTPLGRLLNFHPQTNSGMVKKSAIVKTGDVVDDNTLADIERLVREMPTIRDARLYVSPVKGSRDSIDLVIVTQDYFPINISADYRSANNFNTGIADKNITGTAFETGFNIQRRTDLSPDYAYIAYVSKNNLFNRFADFKAEGTARDGRKTQSMILNRDFLSEDLPDIGGVYMKHVQDKYVKSDPVSAYELLNGGAWYGHSFTGENHWSIVPAIAFDAYSYSAKPAYSENASFGLLDRHNVIGSITVLKREFIRSALVNDFGTSEYFPVGIAVNMASGIEVTQRFTRYNFNGGVSWSRFVNDVGYLGVSFKSGVYHHGKRLEDLNAMLTFNYFSPLLKLGLVRWRQFADFTFRNVQLRYASPLIPLNGPWSNASGVSPDGDTYVQYGIQQVFYMPWYLYGFRFSFFDGIDIYQLHTVTTGLNGGAFPVYKVALNIQNDFFTYSALSLKAEWYPSANGYKSYFSLAFKSFIMRSFTGLSIGRPTFGF